MTAHIEPMRDPRLMSPGGFRKLSPGERDLAAEVFGGGIDCGRVRIFALPVWNRAFVAGPRLMVWPAREALADFSSAALEVQGVFVHELVHVWQAQSGLNLILGKLRAGDSAQSYGYDLSQNRDFQSHNIEQQAMIVQDAFMAGRGGPAPFESHAYSAILATWPGCAAQSPREVYGLSPLRGANAPPYRDSTAVSAQVNRPRP